MKCRVIIAAFIIPILLFTSACNLQVAGPSSGNVVPPAEVQTMSVQTGIANALAGTLTAMVPTFTPSPSNTPTLSGLLVSVSLATNCRTGPGQAYDMIGALDVGKSAEVVGKDAYNQYWIIENPHNPGTCWLWGQYATVTGDTSQLPVIAAPPTPTPIPTPKTEPVVTNLAITVGTSAFHDPQCHFSQSLTVKATTNGPAKIHHYIKYYLNGIEYATLGPNVTTVLAAGTLTLSTATQTGNSCGTWVYKVFVTSPNSKTSQVSFTVSH